MLPGPGSGYELNKRNSFRSVENETAIGVVRIIIQVVESTCIERGRPADRAMHLIAVVQEQVGQA